MKKVSILFAIVFLIIAVIIFFNCHGYIYGEVCEKLHLTSVPFGFSALFWIIGLMPGEKAAEEKSNDAEMSLTELRDEGLLSEEEYQRKLKMTRNGVQNLMDDLKSLRDGGILTEEEYQQKVNQLLK